MKDAYTFLLTLCFALFPLSLAWSEEEESDPAKLDPSDIYFQGWMALRDAEEYSQDNKPEKAFESASRCKRFIDTVTLYHPDWKPHLVERKRKECAEAIEKLVALLPKDPLNEHQLYQSPPTKQAAPGLTPAEILQATRIQRDLADTRAKLRQSQDLRNADVARLQRKIGELQVERDKLASSTLSAEVKQLKTRLDLVESEKQALARSLYEARSELQTTKTQLEARVSDLETKEKAARKVANELNTMLEKERVVTNDVIDALRGQQKQLSSELQETKSLLTLEQRKSEKLQRLLSDTRGEVETLTLERNHLLKERDQLSELLQLNQGDRIQRLIEQNMTLARDLRESTEEIDLLTKNADASAEELLEAKRDLAMSKAQIIELRKESDAELQRRLTLERRLTDAHTELSARTDLADIDADLREENEMLRSVAEKLLVTQKRRRDQATILLNAAKERAEEDPSYEEAVQQLIGEELVLTPEQESLIDNPSASVFRFADRATPEEVELAGIELRRYTSAIGTAINKAYNRGKTEVALDLCEQLLDENPGHVPTMVNQGVIRLRMGFLELATESFENAVTMQGNNRLPYLHYLLGVTHQEIGEQEEAAREYEIAIALNPSNADAHNGLGIVHAQQNQMGEAREHFELAYRIDKSRLEPLDNLTRLHLQLGENAAAANYYREFRKAGGSPLPEFEKLLAEELKKPEAVEAQQPEPIPTDAVPIIASPN